MTIPPLMAPTPPPMGPVARFIAPAGNVAATTALLWGAFGTGMGIGHYADVATGGAISNSIANAIQRVAGPAPPALIHVGERLNLAKFDGRPSWMK
jgi:hypothetical protein